MKTRIYRQVTDHLFCPNCHREVSSSMFQFNNVIAGKIKIICSRCKNGEVVIQSEKKVEEPKPEEAAEKVADKI